MKTRSFHTLLSFVLITAVLALCFCPFPARGEDVTYEFAFGVHTIGTDEYVRHVGPDLSADTLGSDEYYVLYLTLRNGTGKAMHISKAVLTVDSTSWTWSDLTVKTAHSLRLSYDSMKSIGAGTHQCTLKLDGKTVFTHTFDMPRDWGSLMPLPTQAQLNSRSGSLRSPYIAYYMRFPSGGFTEYSIELRTDHDPLGTYICPMMWWMDLSALEKQYEKVWADYGSPGAGYCGLQVWNDGTHGVIMTLWDVFCRDRSGHVTQIKAEVLYPKNAADTRHDNSSEGSFVHYSYPFDWKPGRDYRLLLQQYTGDSGNKQMDLWILDITANAWTLLFSFDTHIRSDIPIYSIGGFLEDFNSATAGEVRTMEFRNARAHMKKTGRWVNAEGVTFAVNVSVGITDYSGSYNFGQDSRSCWIITSGVQGLGRPNQNTGPYKVPSTGSGQPY